MIKYSFKLRIHVPFCWMVKIENRVAAETKQSSSKFSMHARKVRYKFNGGSRKIFINSAELGFSVDFHIFRVEIQLLAI